MNRECIQLNNPVPHREIRLNFRAELAQYSLSVHQSDSGIGETLGSILFNGTVVDEEDCSRVNRARFSLNVLKSRQKELNAELDIYPQLNSSTDSPELLLAGGLPPIMGYLILPSDAFDDLRLQANLYDERRLHSLNLSLPIAEEFYDSEHPDVPVTPECPIPLTALDLNKKIKILGCHHFTYHYLAKENFKR